MVSFLYFKIINYIRFNLLFNLVPLIGLYRQISIKKTPLIYKEKAHFLSK